ncbi:hypothetical protein LTS10_009699 [Elasticomyces elasticus]|nr:hypothetical protein LTS10_009699 [Elasticomyces elasticus]
MDTSPFGKLSAELRNQIYELVIYKPTSIAVHYDASAARFMSRFGTTGDEKAANSFAISRVCRAMRHECTGMIYSGNSFEFTVVDLKNPLAELDTFRTLIGPKNARLLRPSIILHLNPSGSMRIYSPITLQTLDVLHVRALLQPKEYDSLRVVFHYPLEYMRWVMGDWTFTAEFDIQDFASSCNTTQARLTRGTTAGKGDAELGRLKTVSRAVRNWALHRAGKPVSVWAW